MNSELSYIKSAINKGELSPLTLTTNKLADIKASKLNAFITVDDQFALNMAKQSAERIMTGQPRSLEGLTIAVKDIFCTKGVRTTAASAMLENFTPNYESTVTQKLWNSGAILIGKTNMDEFAMGSSNEYSYFGPCRNPCDLDRVPGGSSGGSAAAVAANLCDAAIGSDTGGSVRQPASFCGIVGFKPSYGRCSRFGMIAYSSSLDQAGILAKSVNDACIVLDQIVGPCTKDSTSRSEYWHNLEQVEPKISDKTIGYIPEDMQLVSKEVKEVWETTIEIVKRSGAKVIELQYKDLDPNIQRNQRLTDNWLAAYYILSPVEAFSNLSRYDGIRYGKRSCANSLHEYYENTRDNFGSEVKRRLVLGSQILLSESTEHYYHSALDYVGTIRAQFESIYKKVDLILTPTSPGTAFKLQEQVSPERMYAEDIFTIIANLLMSPAISIPGPTKGLPIGIQLMAKRFNERELAEVAKYLEIEFKRYKNE